jgi:hypothetical protein
MSSRAHKPEKKSPAATLQCPTAPSSSHKLQPLQFEVVGRLDLRPSLSKRHQQVDPPEDNPDQLKLQRTHTQVNNAATESPKLHTPPKQARKTWENSENPRTVTLRAESLPTT